MAVQFDTEHDKTVALSARLDLLLKRMNEVVENLSEIIQEEEKKEQDKKS